MALVKNLSPEGEGEKKVRAADAAQRVIKKLSGSSSLDEQKYMPTDAQLRKGKIKEKTGKWLLLMICASFLQAFMFITAVVRADQEDRAIMSFFLIGYLLVEWAYFFVFGIIGRRRMEIELIGFSLSSISLVLTASISPSKLMTQFICIVAGIITFAIIIWFLEDISRVNFMRLPIGIVALGLLALTLLIAEDFQGAKNWIHIGGFSIQPSELVKIAFVFVGAATLEKLQSTHSLWKYIIFAAACIGMLFLMRDFGTALIFFATFLMIAFMRSGDIKTIFLICAAAVLGAVFIIMYKPYVARRFANYRHIWEYMNEGGMQQTRSIIYSVSGGLFGVGIGNGKLRHVFAAAEDLVFGVVCEELGIIIAVAIVMTYVLLLLYTIRSAKFARSSFYAIAGCAAAGMLCFQAALEVFGINDILPLTGVTLPFISRGGSSMLCSWGLLAFIKALDLRTYPKVMKELFQTAKR